MKSKVWFALVQDGEDFLVNDEVIWFMFFDWYDKKGYGEPCIQFFKDCGYFHTGVSLSNDEYLFYETVSLSKIGNEMLKYYRRKYFFKQKELKQIKDNVYDFIFNRTTYYKTSNDQKKEREQE